MTFARKRSPLDRAVRSVTDGGGAGVAVRGLRYSRCVARPADRFAKPMGAQGLGEQEVLERGSSCAVTRWDPLARVKASDERAKVKTFVTRPPAAGAATRGHLLRRPCRRRRRSGAAASVEHRGARGAGATGWRARSAAIGSAHAARRRPRGGCDCRGTLQLARASETWGSGWNRPAQAQWSWRPNGWATTGCTREAYG